jgi:serine/threonine-protein kinase
MATVWLVVHLVTQRRSALKIMRPMLAEDVDARLRFLREARAAAKVQHPNVVDVHDVIELEDGTPAIVMEYFDGETLAARLDRHVLLPIGDIVPIATQVCAALEAAHAAGVVHRDLKPANILIVHGEAVKVLDFGLAKLLADPKLTKTGMVLGTPDFMAPEQVFGDTDIDARADIWALGVILYEGLSGRRSLFGETMGQIVKTMTRGSIPPLNVVAQKVPIEISTLVEKMLSIEREQRPSSASEVRAILERHMPVRWDDKTQPR